MKHLEISDMSHHPPRLSLDSPWWGVARQIAKGEPLRKREIEAILKVHPTPPDWVRAAITQHDRDNSWAKGRAPVGGFKRLQKMTQALSLYEAFYEEEKTRKRERWMETPSNRALTRVAETMRVAPDTARDLVFPGRVKPRKHAKPQAK